MFASWIVGHSVLQRVKAGEKEWAGSGKVYIIGGGGVFSKRENDAG